MKVSIQKRNYHELYQLYRRAPQSKYTSSLQHQRGQFKQVKMSINKSSNCVHDFKKHCLPKLQFEIAVVVGKTLTGKGTKTVDPDYVIIVRNDNETWYMDSSDEHQQLKSQTVSVFFHNFSLLTANFLNPKVEFNVIKNFQYIKNFSIE